MKSHTTYPRALLRAAAPWASCAAVFGATSTTALATVTFNSGASSATVTHSSGGGPVTTGGITVSSGTASNTYGAGTPKKDKINYSGGTDSTTAKAGAGQTSSSSQALLLLPTGMGVDEVDATSPFTGPSYVVLDFNLVWDVSGSDFTPSNTAFNVTVGGTVGAGGSTRFEAACQWDKKTGASTTFNVRSPYTQDVTFGTSGSYLFTFNSGPAAVSVAAGSQLIMHGSVKMSANDPMDPSVMDFLRLGQSAGAPPDPQPDWGVMIVPDTADSPVTWNGSGGNGGNGNWSDPTLWSTGDVPFHPTDHVQLDSGKPTGSSVALDMNAAAADVQLDPGDGLDVTPGNRLSLFGPNPSSFAGTFSNNGTMELLNSTGAAVTGTGTHSGAFLIDAGSNLQFAGGTNVLTNASSITGAGNVLVTGGTLTLNGTSAHTGGTGVAGGTIVVGNADAIGGGSAVAISGGGFVQASAGLPKGISVASVATTTGGKFDLTNNAMVVRASTLAAVAAEVAKGAANTKAPSEGIVSSTAQSDPSGLTAIGFADNGVLGLASFHGVSPLTSSDILVALTYYGDADLSNTVTLTDFNQFVNGYTHPGTVVQTWLNGDFNYSSTVTLEDFNVFLDSYYHLGGSLTSLDSAIDAAAGLSAADMATMHQAVAAVPEPAAAIMLLSLTGAAGLLRRRRG